MCSGRPARKRSRRKFDKETNKSQSKKNDQEPRAFPDIPVASVPSSNGRKGLKKEFTPRGPTVRQQWLESGRLNPNPSDKDAGVLPEVVSQRMFRRLLVLGGIPFSLFLAFFAAYAVLAFRFEIRVLPSVVAYSTLGTVGLAGIGLTYGIFSASWDADVEGSFLGWAEAQKNFLRAYDGVKTAIEKEKR